MQWRREQLDPRSSVAVMITVLMAVLPSQYRHGCLECALLLCPIRSHLHDIFLLSSVKLTPSPSLCGADPCLVLPQEAEMQAEREREHAADRAARLALREQQRRRELVRFGPKCLISTQKGTDGKTNFKLESGNPFVACT